MVDITVGASVEVDKLKEAWDNVSLGHSVTDGKVVVRIG
jgi:hypothetical protein